MNKWIEFMTIIIMIIGGMVLGGYLSCESGGGEYRGGTCMNIEVVQACEFEGELYHLPTNQPEWIINDAGWINVTG